MLLLINNTNEQIQDGRRDVIYIFSINQVHASVLKGSYLTVLAMFQATNK